MPDGNGVMLKVNGIPFQTDCLTAAKSVECAEQNRQLKLASLGGCKESVHLIGIIEAANKAVLFGRSTLSAGFTSIRSIFTAYLSAL